MVCKHYSQNNKETLDKISASMMYGYSSFDSFFFLKSQQILL